jgi:hypothetical protein
MAKMERLGLQGRKATPALGAQLVLKVQQVQQAQLALKDPKVILGIQASKETMGHRGL